LIAPTAQALSEAKSATPFNTLVLSPPIFGAGKAFHVLPSKWMVVCPTAHMSLVDEADMARRSF